MGGRMTRDDIIQALKLAQDALQMASAPFPVDEIKTMRALQAVNKLLQEMEQSWLQAGGM
jgi:hypothetical protein